LAGQAELRVLEQGINLTRHRRVAAIKKCFEVEASELRTAAQAKRAESAKVVASAEPLIKKLRGIEGVPDDAVLVFASEWVDTVPRALPVANLNRPLPLRSRQLVAEADALDLQAREAEEREVQTSGVVAAKANVEELLASEELADAFSLTPATHSILAWAAAVEDKIPAEQLGRQRRYRLAWRSGEINADDCSVSLRTGSYFGDTVYTAEVPA
jgi:hypothetical protein